MTETTESTLDYNKVFAFMQKFKIDFLNRINELHIDEMTNLYVSIDECKTIQDVEVAVLSTLCRPLGGFRVLEDENQAIKLRNRVNDYFGSNLERYDFLLIYEHLYITSEEDHQEFKDFIKKGFPMHELHLIDEEMD